MASSLATEPTSSGKWLGTSAPLWGLCLVGVLLVWQLASLNSALQAQNHLLADQAKALGAVVDSTSNITQALENPRRGAQTQPPNYTNLLGALMMEVRQLREVIEKQKR